MGWWNDLWNNVKNWEGVGGGSQNPAVQGRKPVSEQEDWYKQRNENKRRRELDELVKNPAPLTDNWKVKSDIFGEKNLSNTSSKELDRSGPSNPNANATSYVPPATVIQPATVDNSGLLKGYLQEIQDRLANSKATAPTVTLDTAPIDDAKASSIKALEQALSSVVAGIGTARANTKSAYGQAQSNTQDAYDNIVANSRKEGKKSAESAGDYVQDALSDVASTALAGTNQAMTNSDKLMAEAAKNLGGGAGVNKSVDNKADTYDSTETIRNNISQNFQDEANNAAKQTGRDITASSRYADTIASDGAGAVADLVAELANRNNQYDRDVSDAKTANASNVANVQSTYADKLMSAQLAQQQEQNSLNNSAWQTNTNNDSNALDAMLSLMESENSSRTQQESNANKAANDLALQEAQIASKNANAGQSAKNKQVEILLKGLVDNTDKNRVSDKQIQEILAQIQSQ